MNLKHIYLIVFVLFTVTSCANKSNEVADIVSDNINEIVISQAQFKQGNMLLGNLESKNFPNTITVNGMIDVPPENRAIASTSMGGYIKTTPLLVGDEVKKGQILVTIENPMFIELQQRYLEINEQLRYLKSEFERHKSMISENIISEKSFLKAESEYKTALASHSGLEKQLEMLNISTAKVKQGNITSIIPIYSPISGSIVKVNVSKGSHVSPATEIIEIINNEHIHLELSVFEKDIMKIKKGQEIIFKISEASDEYFKAEVYLVGRSINDDRTIKVHAHLKNEEDNSFLSGMFVQAEIVINESSNLALPVSAIVENNGTYEVLVLEKSEEGNYVFISKEVIVGSSYNGFQTITNSNDFSTETKFLVSGAFTLISE